MVAATHVSPVNYGVVGSDGTATLSVICGQFYWLVYHKAVSMTPSKSVPPVCQVFRNQSSQPEMLLDYTSNGNGDSSDSKHLLYPGDSLIAVWSSGTTGARVAMRLEAIQFPPDTPLTTIAGLL